MLGAQRLFAEVKRLLLQLYVRLLLVKAVVVFDVAESQVAVGPRHLRVQSFELKRGRGFHVHQALALDSEVGLIQIVVVCVVCRHVIGRIGLEGCKVKAVKSGRSNSWFGSGVALLCYLDQEVCLVEQ